MHLFPLFKNLSYGARIVLLILLLTFSIIISTILATLIISLVSGTGKPLLEDITNNITSLRIMQILNQIGVFVIPTLFFAALTEKKPLTYLGFKPFKPILLIITISLIISISPFNTLLIEWNEKIQLPAGLERIEEWMRTTEDNTEKLIEKIVSYSDTQSILINILMIGILPAIGEELLFRAVLINIFKGMFKNIHVAVWVSALIFSAFHLQFFGFFPRMLLGLLFGYIYVWSGSLWLPIIAHFINNITVLTVMYLSKSGMNQFADTELSSPTFIIAVILSIATTTILSIAFMRYRVHEQEQNYNMLDEGTGDN